MEPMETTFIGEPFAVAILIGEAGEMQLLRRDKLGVIWEEPE